MKRQNFSEKSKLPDVINCSTEKEFTMIPNELLRNPELSAKAKIILSILLSNKEGWHSYMTKIVTMMKESVDAIRTGIKELEQFNYLIRIRYRDKITKTIKGILWACSSIPNDFNLKKIHKLLSDNNLEIANKLELIDNQPQWENPEDGNPSHGKPHTKNTNINNTNIKNTNDNFSSKNISSSSDDEKNKKIVSSQFDLFWEIYPKKSDKGKAYASWNNICTRKNHKPPTWEEIKTALEEQIKSERWQKKQFIPMPATWLNKFRWLDDPKEMIDYEKHNSSSNNNTSSLFKYRKPSNGSLSYVEDVVKDQELQNFKTALKTKISNTKN